MLTGDWRKFLKDRGGLILAGTIAAIFVIVTIQLARGWQWEIDYDASRNAASYAADAEQDARAECAAVAPQARDQCQDEIDDAARANQRDEYDLAAQQTMALWTAIMGGMAVIGVSLSGVGVYLIWRTWDATREAAANSAGTLRAFIAKERAILEQRDGFHTKRLSDLKEGVSFSLENIGAAPCTLRSIRWSYIAKPEWPDHLDHSLDTIRIIPPGKKEGTPCLTWNVGPEVARPIYLVGTAEYETLDSEKFETHFGLIVARTPEDGYGPENWSVVRIYIAGRPFNT